MPPAPRISDQILSRTLTTEENLFGELAASTRWESVGKGRRGAVLARIDEAGGVPLVRTTTRYVSPTQRFRAVHERLAEQVRQCVPIPVDFNNALVECYTNAYATMGSHSDQALDLADESFIAVFSCYQHPEAGSPRKLIFETKDSGGETFETSLAHNSIVAFSVAANRLLRHRIILAAPGQSTENQWLGVTFRTSKTSVRFRDGRAYLPGGARLVSADDGQRQEFYQLRRRENKETSFVYPALTYTVSESDLMPPV